jgi:MFS transporter, SP family, inositol transporter
MTTSARKASKVPIPRNAWKVAILAGAASYIDCAAMVSTGIAIVMYQEQLGLGPGEIGAVSGLLAFFFAVGALVGGRLGDKFGRRRVFGLTVLAVAVGAALMMFAIDPWMLFVGVVIMGFGIGADLPVSLAMIAEEAPEGAKARLVSFSQVLWVVAGISTIILVISFGNLGALCGRILFGHVVLVSVLLMILRSAMPESREWISAKAAVGDTNVHAARFDAASLKALLVGPYFPALLATGAFYALVNLAVNTGGAYTTYMYVNLAGETAQFASLVSFGTVGLGLVTTLVFMRIVDRPSRMKWFAVGAVLYILGPLAPVLLGVNVLSLILFSLLVCLGSAFAGEAIYKVWSQELFPTLLRSSAQGVTIAFARFVAAGFAAVTPLLLTADPAYIFVTLTVIAVVTALMGIFWLGRLPRLSETHAEMNGSNESHAKQHLPTSPR